MNVGTGLILPLNAVAVYLSTFSSVIQLGFATKQLHYIMLCMECLDRQGAKIAVFHGERTNGKRFSKYNTQGLLLVLPDVKLSMSNRAMNEW